MNDIRKKNLLKISQMAEATNTYSSMMRSLKSDPEKREIFMRLFKDAFDEACSQSLEDPQNVALIKAQIELNDS